MKNRFNWGIIGHERIARKFAEALTVVDGANLCAVASNNIDRVNNFAKDFNIEKSYYAYEDLVNDKEIDAVYIAAPHRFHFANTKLNLEANKPVLCDKTLNCKLYRN